MQQVEIYELSCERCGAIATHGLIIEGMDCGVHCEYCAKRERDSVEDANQIERNNGPDWLDI